MGSTAHITVNIQTERLRLLGTTPSGPIFRHAVKFGARVQTKAARNLSGAMVKVQTGNLRSSLSNKTEIRGGLLVQSVIADASYALAVHDGQKPHDIVPREKRVLAWAGPGGTRFANRVHHPGTKGRPFLRDALSEVR